MEIPLSAKRADGILDAVLDLACSAREEYIIRACGGDLTLFAEVRALLAAHEAMPTGFLSQPAMEEIAAGELDVTIHSLPVATPPLHAAELAGEMIGHYKLREQIGEGGFGTVWVADQEQPVRRRVALKIIKLGMDTKEVIARFEQERQALAMMEHPNIARVLDAGVTQTGRPYFVMELVRGVKITDYCDEKALSTNERIDLFIHVCQAVQHAHQKGIIHRDLKPSNILVTINDGVAVPKVIDFGVAKATQGRLTDGTIYTQFQQMIGTPLYMSPEQAEMTSLDVDTRSDIYALGVMLYELLTGRTPIDNTTMAKAGMDEIRRLIREVDPPKPSARLKTLAGDELTSMAKRRHTEPAKLSGTLRGDLDWIVMKCIEKDRARRYDTANGLAMDLQRHLKNEVVIARPPTTAYLLSKLIRRNKLAFAAGAAIAAALVIGIAASVWQAVRASRAEKQAVAVLDELRASAPAFAAEAHGLAAREQFEQAIAKLDYALKLRPDMAEFLVKKADLLQCQLKLAEAAAVYRAALAIKPEHARAEASAALCDELLTAPRTADGRLARESLARLQTSMQQQQRQAAELLPVARLLGDETKFLIAFWLERLKDLPVPPEKPLKDRLTIREDGLLALDLSGTMINNFAPIAGMPLGKLMLTDCNQIADFTPLGEFRSLSALNLNSTRITNLAPLRGLPLESLELDSTAISDLSPLQGMKLKLIDLWNTRVADLSPLAGMPLTEFSASLLPTFDFSALKGAPLEACSIAQSQVRDLSFLAGSPVKTVYLQGCDALRGLSQLGGLRSLERLVLPGEYRQLPEAELAAIAALREHPTLKWIQADPGEGDYRFWQMSLATQSKEVFWQDWDREQSFVPAIRAAGFDFRMRKLPDGTYFLSIQNQPLKDLSILKGAPISQLYIGATAVTDLSPLAGLPLQWLQIWSTPVSDLSPLQNLSLESLSIEGTNVSDLTPLTKLPLKKLYAHDCKNLTDLSPLTAIPTLENLTIPPTARNIDELRSLKNLKWLGFRGDDGAGRVRSTPAEDFWKEWPNLAWLPALTESGIAFKTLKQLDDLTWQVNLSDSSISDLSILRGASISLLNLGSTPVSDLGPLHGMPLKRLFLYHTKVTDLRPLEGMALEYLNIAGTEVSDLSRVRGMPLKALRLHSCAVLTDLSPLTEAKELTTLTLPTNPKNMGFLRDLPKLAHLGFNERSKPDMLPDKSREVFWMEYDEQSWQNALRESGLKPKLLKQLEDGTWDVNLQDTKLSDLGILTGARISKLNVGGTAITDLTPLRGLPLTSLIFHGTKVRDLSPLQGLGLNNLHFSGTHVGDLTPLRGMPLKFLGLGNTPVADLSPLHGMALVQIKLRNTAVTDLSPLADSKTLEAISLPAKARDVEFLRDFPNLRLISYTETPKTYMPDRSAKEFWVEFAERRVLNAMPGDAGKHQKLADGTWELDFGFSALTDLTPLKDLRISSLKLGDTPVADLGPLRDQKLRKLGLNGTKVTDLSPLDRQPIEDLSLHNTKVADLSALRGMPLTWLNLRGTPVTDLSPLAASKSLEVLVLPASAKDIEFLRDFQKLERLGYDEGKGDGGLPGQPFAEFWEEYDTSKK